jgi:hypothetical protein
MENNTPAEFTILGGSFLDYDRVRLAGLSRKTDLLAIRKDGSSIDCLIYDNSDVQCSLFGENIDCEIQSPENKMLLQESRMAGSYKGASVVFSETGLSQEAYLTFCHIIDRVKQLFFDWSIHLAFKLA